MLFERSPLVPVEPIELDPNAPVMSLRGLEKAFSVGIDQTYAPARLDGHQGGRVRLDHGTVGRPQIYSAARARRARPDVVWRIPVDGTLDPAPPPEGSGRLAEAAHRLRVPELSVGYADRIREHRAAVVVS
jgi:hypothetical protein